MEAVWTQGVFKSRSKLVSNPQRVLLSCSIDRPILSSPIRCIAICKLNTLQTQPLVDTHFRLPSYDSCHYPNVIQANCHVTREYREIIDESLILKSKVFPTYYTLNVAESFLNNYSFYEGETIWFRPSHSCPLEKIYLRVSSDSSPEYSTDEHIRKAISRILSDAQQETVIFNQDFEFVHQPPSEQEMVTSPIFYKSSSSSSSNDDIVLDNTADDTLSLPPPLFFNVLGATPTSQGHVTTETNFIVISSDNSEDGTGFTRMSTLEPKKSVPVQHNIEEEKEEKDEVGDDIFEDTLTFPKFQGSITPPIRLHSASLSSASDFPFVDSVIPNTESISLPRTPHFLIEVRPVLNFKLQYHFILLPKHIALQYNIFNLHNVLMRAFSSGPAHSDPLTPLDMVLTLSNTLREEEEEEEEGEESLLSLRLGLNQRKHIGIVRLYEDEKELELYIPQMKLGRKYDTNDLTSAYLHPELLFNIFPETLSIYPRRYLVEIEDLMATPSSTFSQSKTHPLSISGMKKHVTGVHVGLVLTQDVGEEKEEIQRYLRRHIDQLKVTTGDVFSINSDNSRLILRVNKVEPDGIEEGGLLKEDTLFYDGYTHSYLPYLVSPSPFAPPTSYWDEVRPPGLEKYCEELFSHFLASITPKASSISRCTIALITGPLGVGKKSVIRSVAKQCRLQVIEVNCYEITSDAIAFAEGKLRVVFDEAIRKAPCVLILRELQVLTLFGPNEATHEDEPRLLLAFEKFISSMETNNSCSPVIVVGVASELHLVSPSIQQFFLCEMVMTPPTLEERRVMLQGLSCYTLLSPEINCLDVAQKTAGFVLGDFVTLFSHAKEIAVKELLSDLDTFDTPKTWLTLQDFAIAGVLISSKHLEHALNKLHSLHSSSIGAAKIPQVKWKDVGGLETAKKEILETIQLPILHPELFAGGLRRSGILLYGAPGTGKTLLAKAVATECSLNFISIKGPELINMYVGQTEENIREVFTRARGAAPCVIFFDELDSIAPNRGKTGDAGGVMDRVVSQLLAELDGMEKAEDVFVIGATNRPDLIDPALLRPGRFDRLVYLDVCDDTNSKLVILRALTRKFKLHRDVNLEEVAKASPTGLTGADLYALCADAIMVTLRKQIQLLEAEGKGDDQWEGNLEVCQEEFLSAASNLTPSISQAELDKYRNKKSFSNVM